jgi:hypothetical protein
MEFFTEHWAEICLIIITAAGSYTALTESTEDDKIVDVLRRIVNAVIMGRNK